MSSVQVAVGSMIISPSHSAKQSPTTALSIKSFLLDSLSWLTAVGSNIYLLVSRVTTLVDGCGLFDGPTVPIPHGWIYTIVVLLVSVGSSVADRMLTNAAPLTSVLVKNSAKFNSAASLQGNRNIVITQRKIKLRENKVQLTLVSGVKVLCHAHPRQNVVREM